MGPTACGKSQLAIDLAKLLPLHLISVDSALIYKDMNIGTAKPSPSIQKTFPHSLIDIKNPDEKYNVGNFYQDAKYEIEKAIANKKIPFLVGGTNFYFNTLSSGLSELPQSNNKSRKYINTMFKENSLLYLYNKLKSIDKISAEKIHSNDTQRICRALEIFFITGKPLSSLQKTNSKKALNYPISKIIVLPERELIHNNIISRFEKMLDDDFIDEVKYIVNKYKLNSQHQSMQAVGYKQILAYLNNKHSLDEMKFRSIVATRQLCKHQITWLRPIIKNNTNTYLFEKINTMEIYDLMKKIIDV